MLSCDPRAVFALAPVEQVNESLCWHLQKRPPHPPRPLGQLCPMEDGDTQLCGEVRARTFTCCLSLLGDGFFPSCDLMGDCVT